MKNLFVYLRAYKKEMVLSPLFKLLEAFFELAVPLVVASIVDVGIDKGNTSHVVKCTLLMALLGLVGLICAVTAQFFAARAAVGFAEKVRAALFRHIQTFSYTKLDTLGTTSLITNMTSDVGQVQTGVNLVLRLFLRSPVIVFGAMIMAFTIDVNAAIPFVILIHALSAVVFSIMLAGIPLYKKVQKKLDRMLGITRENLNGTRVVRAFNMEETEKASFHLANGEFTAAQKFAGGFSALMNPLTFVLVNAAIILLVHRGALRVDNGVLTQGQLIALYNYMSQILVELVKLANLIITVTKAVASGNRIGEVLKTSFEESNTHSSADTPTTAEAIRFENVSLRYSGAGAESLSDISFSIEKGQVLGIIGSTGSGKSSLVSMIPRFYPATKGQIFIGGKAIETYSETELREKIGVVPQKAVLFKGTVRSNLLFGNRNAGEDALIEALKASQSFDFVMQKTGGLDAPVEQGGRNFSGGQRQRLTIARALAIRPEILILDDSASALDYATDAA
ncbi:MAG: ABC transporter ATP-binding protein, partial [Clostridia bacterium]|nr:ABC transporter ATP-binding protein [Clostridia bacterium]